MGNSLQEQLLKTGLVDKSRANKAKKQQKTQARQQRNVKGGPVPQPDPQRQRELEEKAAHDRELNERRNEARRQREIAAQVKQLVSNHRQLYVSPETHKMITSGKLRIVNQNGVFELVPPDIAEKIRQRNPSLVIDLPEERGPNEDDPYAQYQVPDDLMW